MSKAIIKLACRQVIDHTSAGNFERDVFIDSYNEFMLQAQAYNRESKYTTLQEMIHNNPKANSLHYKVGFAVGLFINGLKNKIPGLLDSLDRGVVPFDTHEFHIVESDITNRNAHKVAITYTTPELLLIEVIGEHLLLGLPVAGTDGFETFMVKIQPGLTITDYAIYAGRVLDNSDI